MDNLLSKQTVSISQCVVDCQEECAVSGEFTLPDYCRDMAMVLKCRMTPYIRQRHSHGDKLTLDILVCIRVLYLDEERCAPRAVEFTIPTACTLPAQSQLGMQEMDILIKEKYVNCRALSPRRIEVRGAVAVSAKAMVCANREIAVAQSKNGLHIRPKTVRFSYPIGTVEKVLSLHESLDFPETMPPAEMLLGGECRAVVKECKLLAGKGIVKGNIYVHQLYAVDTENGECRCLDYVLPFSQIMDIDGANEEMSYRVNVQILSDIERCMTGARGENTMLDVALKLSIQLQVFNSDQTKVLLDAFHTNYPITATKTESRFVTHLGCRFENAVLPMKVPLHPQKLSQILDVWVEQQECHTRCAQGMANIRGCLCVCVLAKDEEGQVVYIEHPEDFCMEFPCTGNRIEAMVTTTELHYRVVEDQLELQIAVSVLLDEENVEDIPILQQITGHKDQLYPPQKVGLIAYYAQSGEDLWDIAAHCRTAPECIGAENGLTEDILQQATMLMVPIVS